MLFNLISFPPPQRQLQPSGSPYHTILPLDTTLNPRLQGLHLANQLKQFRSNSWSDSLDDFRTALGLPETTSRHPVLLSDTHRLFYDTLKRGYADLLHRWGLLVTRSKVLKYLSVPPQETGKGMDVVTLNAVCMNCNRSSRGVSCSICQSPLLYCALCQLPVKGAATACLQCGHGGHTLHMKHWFERNTVCASGCGCECQEYHGEM